MAARTRQNVSKYMCVERRKKNIRTNFMRGVDADVRSLLNGAWPLFCKAWEMADPLIVAQTVHRRYQPLN